MDRLVYCTPQRFFHAGRKARGKLVEEHGRLDPLIGSLALNEMRGDWWRHLLVTVPLGWCGMGVGGALGLGGSSPTTRAPSLLESRDRRLSDGVRGVPAHPRPRCAGSGALPLAHLVLLRRYFVPGLPHSSAGARADARAPVGRETRHRHGAAMGRDGRRACRSA